MQGRCAENQEGVHISPEDYEEKKDDRRERQKEDLEEPNDD